MNDSIKLDSNNNNNDIFNDSLSIDNDIIKQNSEHDKIITPKELFNKQKSDKQIFYVNNSRTATLKREISDGINTSKYTSLLHTQEPELGRVHYPDSLQRAPNTHEGAINRYKINLIDDNNENIPFTDYAPHVFRYLRTEIYGINDENYYNSIKLDGRSNADICAKFSEGRSGAFFFYSYDGQYLIKTLNKEEASFLLTILPHYVQHFTKNKNSYINKFFGLHSIKLYTLIIYFVVFENVFPGNREPKEKYDLKGSYIDRHTNYHVESRKLMKDEDFHQQKSLRLETYKSNEIFNQLEQDTIFLKSQGIMDYSLLLGIYYCSVDPKEIDQQHTRNATAIVHNNINNSNIVDGGDAELSLNEPSMISPDIKSRRTMSSLKYNESKDNNDIIFNNPLNNNNNNSNNNSNNNCSESKRDRAGTYTTVMNTVGYKQQVINARYIEGPGFYYIGIIDMLQKWNFKKKVERFIKIYFRCKDGKGISCMEPNEYRIRFLRKMKRIGIEPINNSNNNNKIHRLSSNIGIQSSINSQSSKNNSNLINVVDSYNI